MYLTLTRKREVADMYINEKLVVTLLPNFIFYLSYHINLQHVDERDVLCAVALTVVTSQQL